MEEEKILQNMPDKDAKYKAEIEKGKNITIQYTQLLHTNITNCRLYLNSVINTTKNFNVSVNGNLFEISDCIKSLSLAKAWLGKSLGVIGYETPYKNDGERKTVDDIEPESDTFPETIKFEGSLIEFFDQLREEIKIVYIRVIEIETLYSNYLLEIDDVHVETELINDLTIELLHTKAKLEEARMICGFMLGQIRDNQKK